MAKTLMVKALIVKIMTAQLFTLIVSLFSFSVYSQQTLGDQTESTRQLAQAFLHKVYIDKNIKAAYQAYAAVDFIQHNPEMANGIAGHQAFFAEKAKKSHGKTAHWVNVNNLVLVDNNLFALFHHAFTHAEDKGRVFVDIWRVEAGRIVEHWDVIQPMPTSFKHNNGMVCQKGNDFASATLLAPTLYNPTCGAPDTSTTRTASLSVLNNYVSMLVNGDVEKAINTWFAKGYRQHSPTIEDGIDGAISYLIKEFGKGKAAMPKQIGKPRIIAEGDYVLSHRQVGYPNETRLFYNVDIFRITQGKISEHWDIKQQQPETSANSNGMW